ncbi:MAG: hypothetical protein QM805_26165 [Pseudomonas sp.]
MKISDHIKYSLDACDARDLDKAMLFACLAVDGTAKKTYPEINRVGERYKRFIDDNIDIVELMFGGINLSETIFPIKGNREKHGLKFAEVIYEKYRCSLAHGDELPEGYGINMRIAEGQASFSIDIHNHTMTMPESAIYALGIICVLAPKNSNERIGNNGYHYRDTINTFPVDRWWGKADCARQVMDFASLARVKLVF